MRAILCQKQTRLGDLQSITKTVYKYVRSEIFPFWDLITPFVKKKVTLSVEEIHFYGIHKRGDKTDYNNYCGILLLSTASVV
jgi:hypothetical protein